MYANIAAQNRKQQNSGYVMHTLGELSSIYFKFCINWFGKFTGRPTAKKIPPPLPEGGKTKLNALNN